MDPVVKVYALLESLSEDHSKLVMVSDFEADSHGVSNLNHQ